MFGLCLFNLNNILMSLGDSGGNMLCFITKEVKWDEHFGWGVKQPYFTNSGQYLWLSGRQRKAAMWLKHYPQYFSICSLPNSAFWIKLSRCCLAWNIEQGRSPLCGADRMTTGVFCQTMALEKGEDVLMHMNTIATAYLLHYIIDSSFIRKKCGIDILESPNNRQIDRQIDNNDLRKTAYSLAYLYGCLLVCHIPKRNAAILREISTTCVLQVKSVQ